MGTEMENVENSADMASFAPKTTKHKRTLAKTQEIGHDVPDLRPDQDFERGVQVLVMDEGILREVPRGSFDFEREEKKNNWIYRKYTASGRYCLVDYDKDKARPWVKALLAKVNKLKEVKMLWFVIGMQVLFAICGLILFLIVIDQIGKTQEMIGKINVKTPPAVSKVVEKEMPDPFEDVKDVQNEQIEKPQSNQTNRIFPNGK